MAKLDLLPRPFFAAPQSMLEVLTDDWLRLGESLLRSLWLLVPAYLLANRVIVVSDRPARMRADLKVELDYPRHRDNPELVRLRREVLGQLGLSS